MALDARDAADRVEQLIILTDRLTGMMAAQCQAFEQRRPQDAAESMEEMTRLANIYRLESQKVRAAPAMIEAAPLEQRARLMRSTEAFDAVLARQGRAIEAARTITEGLVRAIADEVASQRTSGTGYGPAANPHAGDARAITLNKRA
ncbi:flagellar basal body protein [Caulobacter mirabilis]|uniref:Flagellar basal body protein n=1 Tax=Caulobacter mirabilis TaxID=69666 RepID=A0A2D2AWW6_9CAUL|nr:flagellar basal body protein [Caulobacter mirabilis]ATQ42496.1 flagellar basal body protein [Caulobacter mirabilis]